MSDPEGSPGPYVPHAEFAQGLPHGRFRVVVNPKLALPYVVHRTRIAWIAGALILLGAALALAGVSWPGAALVALGWLANRVVRHQAPKIALHLALQDPRAYHEVITNGVMEVQPAA
jgi:hypothetical protein